MLFSIIIGSFSLHSGGNKRKLSTAIALVGNPPIVFLVSGAVYLAYVSRCGRRSDLTLDREVWVRVLDGALRFVLEQDNLLTVPHSTVKTGIGTGEFNAGVTLQWTCIPVNGEVEIFLVI